ncbi:MAG: SufD family Fe-S cluster assembly protein [bacterium]
MTNLDLIKNKYEEISKDTWCKNDGGSCYCINKKVIQAHEIPGCHFAEETVGKVLKLTVTIDEKVQIEKPLTFCFGISSASYKQELDVTINVGAGARAHLNAYCIFPVAQSAHHMLGTFNVGAGAHLTYSETHDHGVTGADVHADIKINIAEGGVCHTNLRATTNRQGKMNMNYKNFLGDQAKAIVNAMVIGKADDSIIIAEEAVLKGIEAKAQLTSRLGLSGASSGLVKGTIKALGSHSFGHLDCVEIIADQATAEAKPGIKVANPTARVTHEAVVGRVNNTQLETLLSRGFNEEEATDIIVRGMMGIL